MILWRAVPRMCGVESRRGGGGRSPSVLGRKGSGNCVCGGRGGEDSLSGPGGDRSSRNMFGVGYTFYFSVWRSGKETGAVMVDQ